MTTKSQGTKKIRKGDKIIVIAGNYAGQTGVVLKRKEDRVVVQGINMRKKHVKKSQQSTKGNILSIECPIHVSNVKVCIGEDKPVKLKVKTDKQGNRQLAYHENGKDVVYRPVKSPAA